MPWTTPTLREVRQMTRDLIVVSLGARAIIPNSVLRIMSDAKANLAYMTLLYIDWLAKQLLPDTAETEWLDRHGTIWLRNSDSTKGRKRATFASGSATFTGIELTVIPVNTPLSYGDAEFITTQEATLSTGPTEVTIVATTPGVIGNVDAGESLSFNPELVDVDSTAVVVSLTGGVDDETDDQLRARVLYRIQNPPMGGDLADYVIWATSVPGVTRAWAYGNEMGIGTITVRFMCDVTREEQFGYPQAGDVQAVREYIDTVRPVTVKDCFVEAPIAYPYDITISGLDIDSALIRARIEDALYQMEIDRLEPGQTLYRSWVDEAISSAIGENHHELTFVTTAMPGTGYLASLGTITYA